MSVSQWLKKLEKTKLINRGWPHLSSTQGGQTPGQQGLTRRRRVAGEAEAAEAFGFLAPATKRAEEGLYG